MKHAAKNTAKNEHSDEWYEEENSRRRGEAIFQFERSGACEIFDDCGDVITGAFILRSKSISEGEMPLRFRGTFASDLEQLLSINTCTYYDEYIKNVETGLCEDGFPSEADTLYTERQQTLIKDLHEYAMLAGSLAKHLASSSLDAWAEILLLTGNRTPGYEMTPALWNLSSDVAKRVAQLLVQATDRLRLDFVIAKLPPFKPQPPKKAEKAQKSSKKR